MPNHATSVLIIGVIAATASAQPSPSLTLLSPTITAQAGRVRIIGSDFGVTRGSSQVLIGGVAVPIARWTDTLITVYVPDAVAPGTDPVQVVTSGGSSNVLPLTLTSRPPASGRIKWRFMADSDRIESRPVLAPDGTIYLQDRDHVYSLSPSGGVNWIFTANNSAYYGRIDRAPDGILYAGFGNRLYSLNPDGTQRWVVTDTSGAPIFAGPSVGPDGNIYAATHDFDVGGLGLFSLTPAGAVRWNSTGFLNRFGFHGEPILFGQADGEPCLFFTSNAPGARDGTFFSFDLQGNVQWERLAGNYPAIGPNGELYAFTNGAGPWMTRFDPASGGVIWNHMATNAFNPEVGQDGTLFCGLGTPGGIQAVAADNTPRWGRAISNPATGASTILSDPAVSMQDHMLLFAGYTIAEPGFFMALDPVSGSTRWSITLPQEGTSGSYPVYVWPGPFNRARFTPDGRTAYLGTARADYADDTTYSYLYSLDTSEGLPPPCPADFNDDGTVNSRDFFEFLTAFFANDSRADFNVSGTVNSQDLFDFLGAFFAGC